MYPNEEKLARALSASSRRQILRLVAERELTVKEIAAQTQMSMSLASRHLQLLSDLGFLQARKEAHHKFYSLKGKDLKELLETYEVVVVKVTKPDSQGTPFPEETIARALSAESRRAIIRLLAERELTVKEIASQTNLSMSLASRHLQLLSDLGFLQARKAANHKFYSLKIKEMNSLLESYTMVMATLWRI